MQVSIHDAARLLGGDVTGQNSIHCPGPGHSRFDRSLQVTFRPDGNFICRSFSRDDWKDCRDHVKAVLGIHDDRPRPVAFNDNRPHVDVDRLRRQKSAAEIWERSIPIAGTLAETYLRSRSLTYEGDTLRFYAGGRAMVGLITSAMTGVPQGIHRTFLDRDGKRTEKKMLGAAAGGVVRLSPDDEVTTGLAVAEGIETALAVPFRPVWACLSAGQLAAFPVLSGIEALTIYADQDKTGVDAANACGQRWHAAGVEVTMAAPLIGDFADRRAA